MPTRDTPEELARLLAEVAAGRPPAPDGSVTLVAPGPEGLAAVLAFANHHVIVADVPEPWLRRRLDPHDVSAPLRARFLDDLADRLGRTYDNLDLVLVADPLPGEPTLALERVSPDADHPRVARSLAYRTEVRAFETSDRAGVLLLGRGVGGRWETAFEVAPEARGRGLGRALVTAARHLVPDGEALWAQVAPGNVASLRAVLAAGGWRPVGGEVVYPGP